MYHKTLCPYLVEVKRISFNTCTLLCILVVCYYYPHMNFETSFPRGSPVERKMQYEIDKAWSIISWYYVIPKKYVGALLYVDNIHDNPSIYYVILVTTPSPQLFCKQEQDGWASGYGCKLLTIGYNACVARVSVVVLCVCVSVATKSVKCGL